MQRHVNKVFVTAWAMTTKIQYFGDLKSTTVHNCKAETVLVVDCYEQLFFLLFFFFVCCSCFLSKQEIK